MGGSDNESSGVFDKLPKPAPTPAPPLPRQRRPRLPNFAKARNMRSVVSALLNQEQAFLLVSLFARETTIAIAPVRIQHLVQNAPRHAPGPRGHHTGSGT